MILPEIRTIPTMAPKKRIQGILQGFKVTFTLEVKYPEYSRPGQTKKSLCISFNFFPPIS